MHVWMYEREMGCDGCIEVCGDVWMDAGRDGWVKVMLYGIGGCMVGMYV